MDEIRGFDVGIMPLPDEPWARGKAVGASRPTAKGGDAVTVASVLPGRIQLGVPGLTLASYR
ncbi:hypothetical protein TMEC54S_03291 [Thauera mechernichensis]